MVKRCGLNQLTQIPTFFATHLNRARHDEKFLSLLRGLDGVFYGGLPIPRGDEDWAYEKGIKLKVLTDDLSAGMNSDVLACRICSEVLSVVPC
jgi:hypothetical protein